MKEKIIIVLLLYIPFKGYSQKLFGVINLTTPFSGITYAEKFNKDEFRPRNARINFSWGFDFIYKGGGINHKLSINQMPFGEGFKLINKFMHPSYPGSDTLLGFAFAKHEDAIDHFIFSYCLQKVGKNEKGFLFHSRIRFNYSIGIGLSLNRSKSYYDQVFSTSSGGRSNPWTYYSYDITIYRDGFGLFLKGEGGFDFISKKGKRILCLKLFYDQGIKNMAQFDIKYQYGYFNDPSKQVDVPEQALYHRGTTFGLSIGVPITIIR